DRRPVLLEQPLDDLDGPVDAGAERPRGGEEHAAAHAFASIDFVTLCCKLASARRTRASARAVSNGRASTRATPRQATRPSGPTACASGPSGRDGVSLIAR